MRLSNKQRQKISNKRVNAEKEGIKFLLSDEEIIKLLNLAGITFDDWGFSSDKKYVLARYGDSGNYEFGNCRFITQKENAKEKKISEKSKKISSLNSKKGLEAINRPESLKKREESLLKYNLRRKEEAIQRRIEKEKFLHKSYIGSKNSQFGTMWITNGEVNKKVNKNDEIPNGYRKGRILK